MNSTRNCRTIEMAPNHTPHTVGLVINPTAGLGKGAQVGVKVLQEFQKVGIEVVNLSGKTAQDALARARAACLEGLSALVVVGGDGMVNLGVNASVNTPTPLGIIAAGSGNDFARALELPVNNVKESVKRIAEAINSNTVESFDAGLVEPFVQEMRPARLLKVDADTDDHHAAATRRWFAGTLSLGLDAAVNLQANTYSWPKGHLKYLRAVIACLAKFKPYAYALTINGKTRNMVGTLAAVSNAPYFGGGIPVAPHASLHDGELNLILAEPLKLAGILRVFPKMYSGRHLEDNAVSTETVKEIVIGQGSEGALPPIAMADGEVIGPVPLRISVQPDALKIVR